MLSKRVMVGDFVRVMLKAVAKSKISDIQFQVSSNPRVSLLQRQCDEELCVSVSLKHFVVRLWGGGVGG